MRHRQILSFLLGLCVLSGGCGGQLYNVSTRPVGPPTGKSAETTNGFNVNAEALDGDQALERFDANLPLAGVIAVDVALANRATTPVNAGSLRLELRAGDGKAFRPLTPKAALKRVMKYYGNSFYRLDARQRTIESYEAAALLPASSIAPGEDRRGILFFETQRNSTQLSGLTLYVFGATPGNAPLNIKLN